MLEGMSDEDRQGFLEKISAAVSVDQALLKCLILGAPLNHDNVIALVGNYCDPNDPADTDFMKLILETLDEVLGVENHPKFRQ